jgi:hypothetical protein
MYPEIPQREAPSITIPSPVTLPSMQHSLLPPYGSVNQANSKELTDRAYQTLATELVKLTDALQRFDTGSKDYDDYLTLINRVTETMYTMRK